MLRNEPVPMVIIELTYTLADLPKHISRLLVIFQGNNGSSKNSIHQNQTVEYAFEDALSV